MAPLARSSRFRSEWRGLREGNPSVIIVLRMVRALNTEWLSKPRIGRAFRVGNPSKFERFCRLFWPIPPSPAPRTEEDAYKLRLVPAPALTKRLVQVLGVLKNMSRAPVGDYVEFGVYNGTSMGCMFDALSRLKMDHVRLFGFDSFQGLPPDVSDDDGGVWRPGQFACPKYVAAANLAKKGVPPDRIFLIEGWYKDTLKTAAAEFDIRNVSVVMVDSDTYSSARLALEFVYPLLNEASAVIFDDWKLNDLDVKGMGEYRAFNEFLSRHAELKASSMKGYNRKSKIFILRKSPNPLLPQVSLY